jgi:fumagillin biosynthesis dioxygenase
MTARDNMRVSVASGTSRDGGGERHPAFQRVSAAKDDAMFLAPNIDLDGIAIARDLDEQGFAIVEGVLTRAQAATMKARLWEIAGELDAAGFSNHTPIIDPNAQNVRVYGLPEHDEAYVRLLSDEAVLRAVEACLGPGPIVSNFSANIARPGARAMRVHSDMALVMPGPWRERWALNVIWCLDDIDAANGATRYIPGSHRYTDLGDLPAQAETLTRAFEAPAGAVIVMDGRTWHSSGDNVTKDRDRALLFAYYTRGFIRQQTNWYETLSAGTIATLDERQRRLFGFGPLANIHGVPLVALS